MKQTSILSIVMVITICLLAGGTAFSATNMILNGNMEMGSPASWTTSVDGGTVTHSWSIVESVSTTHSLRTVVASTAASADWRQLVTGISASNKYRFRVHIYATNVVPGSHAAQLQWIDSSNNYISSTSISSTTANAWVEKIQENITPPAGAVKVYVLLRSYKTGIYYFDDAVLLPQGKETALIDNKFPIGLYNLPGHNLTKNATFDFKGNCSPTPDGTGEDQNPFIWYKGESTGSPAPVHKFDPVGKYITIVMNSTGVADWRQLVKEVDPNTTYQLQCNINASNVTAGSHAIELHWFTAGNVFISSSSYSSTAINTWYNVVVLNVTPPAGTSKVYVMTRAYKPGTYSFKNIYLQVLPSFFGIPQSLTEVKNAGFNFITFYQDHPDAQPFTLNDLNTAGLKAACFLTGDSSYSGIINAVSSSPAIALWSQPDEAAWRDVQIDAGILTTHYNNIVSGGDPYYVSAPHLVLLNHAPRGTQAAPTDFYGSLSPYKTATDIVSFDIYPVPTGNTHSSLTNQTLSCVGDYVDILANPSPAAGQSYAIASDGGVQTKPIWMALQGYGWKDHLLPSDDPSTYDSHGVVLQWFNSNDDFLRADTFCSQVANQWFKVSVPNITPPSGATKVKVIARTKSPGTFYFDDITLTRVSDGVNLVQNSNIEIASGSNPANWSTNTYKSNSTLADPVYSWDTSIYKSSTHSLKNIMSTVAQGDWRQLITGISSAQKYSLNAWIYASSLWYERPTWQETRFMAYDAIINGARGVAYYGTYFVPIRSQLWTELKRIATELNTLSPVLVSPTSFRNVTTSAPDAIETCLFEKSDSLYLLAANKSGSLVSNVNISISGLPLITASEYFDGGTPVTMTSNSFMSDFSAYQVHVYKIDRSSDSAETTPSVIINLITK